MASSGDIEPCPDGQHSPTWDSERGESICANCGLTAATIVTRLGHTFYRSRVDEG